MSQTFDTSQWLAFFTKAGLPPNVAANYALVFSDNRIQLDMLMDLSKEYLYDMGIRVMGDVIAILRFAKEFHTQMAKEKAIGNNTAVWPSKVVGRMVGHYTRPLRSSPKQSPVHFTETETPAKSRGLILVAKGVKEKYSHDSGLRSQKATPKNSTVINLKRSASNDVPAKKARRVPPEEEGAYKIKMPLGITERTRKILEKQQHIQSKFVGLLSSTEEGDPMYPQNSCSKRSVFSRLGDSAVSSSTDSAKPSSSVFERLGPSSKSISDDTPTSTVLGDTNKVKRLGPPLQYQGVLKITTGDKRIISAGTLSKRTVIKPLGMKSPVKRVAVNRNNHILQTNTLRNRISTNGSQGIFSHTINPATQSIQSRLGVKVDARNLARTSILTSQSKRLATKQVSNVFERLGK